MNLPDGALLQGGKYKIVRHISSGGFGNTYEALDVNLDKRVAIKEFFVKDFCSRESDTTLVTIASTAKKPLIEHLKKKFIEEARAIAKMEHENIVKVQALFEENGTAYYVMDYIDGESLSALLKRRGSLPENEAIAIILKVADALGYMHKQYRFHLDVKPANIMIRKDGKVILIDFGSSKQYAEVDGENTTTLAPCYTTGYAPAEQMGNDVVKFTPATDIYALGATFYKMLTGTTPPSATLMASGEGLTPLSASVSERVCNAIMSAMQINKMNRTQSMEEFIKTLTTRVEDENTIFEDNVHENNKTEVKDGLESKGQPIYASKTEFSKKRKTFRYIVIFIICAIIIVCGCSIGYYVFLKRQVVDRHFESASGLTYTYTGEIQFFKPNGSGTGIYPIGTYKGEYKDGQRHGEGTFETHEGENSFKGTFINDKYSNGKLTTSNGYYFVGEFKDGMPYSGTWYDLDGNVDEVLEDGVITTKQSVDPKKN